MSMETVKGVGDGAAGSQGNRPGSMEAILKELQGLNVSVIDGAAANTKMNLSAIRTEDTIVGAVAMADTWAAPTDDKANISIVDLRATGTITVGTVANGDVVTVDGVAFTVVAAITDAQDYRQVLNGGSANATAANLAAAINKMEKIRGNNAKLIASVSTNVVTVTAKAEGTGGNSITLAETGNTFTISGSTLAGGSATGGIKSTTNLSTATLVLYWYNKK